VTSWTVSVSFGPFLGISAMKSTGRSDFVHYQPQPLLLSPLFTTFVHILRLTALVSTEKFQVSAGQSVST
jgi:hypothetical protein